MSMIRLRSMRTGQTQDIPTLCAVEILDLDGNVAVLLKPETMSPAAIRLVTAAEDPETARQYAALFGVRFSRAVVPGLDQLQAAGSTPPTTIMPTG